MRCLALVLALLAMGAAPRAAFGGVARFRGDRRPLLLVRNEVLDRLWPRLLASPAENGRRVSVKNGLLGMGSFAPPGGAGRGIASAPREVFPRAELGNRLHVDPNPGRSAFTNLP